MIILGIIVSIVIGVIGSSIGYGMNAAELGPILSIATMGGFIMAYIKKNNIKCFYTMSYFQNPTGNKHIFCLLQGRFNLRSLLKRRLIILDDISLINEIPYFRTHFLRIPANAVNKIRNQRV